MLNDGQERGTDGCCEPSCAGALGCSCSCARGGGAALRTIAYAEVKKTEKFIIPQLTTLKLKHKPARKRAYQTTTSSGANTCSTCPTMAIRRRHNFLPSKKLEP